MVVYRSRHSESVGYMVVHGMGDREFTVFVVDAMVTITKMAVRAAAKDDGEER